MLQQQNSDIYSKDRFDPHKFVSIMRQMCYVHPDTLKFKDLKVLLAVEIAEFAGNNIAKKIVGAHNLDTISAVMLEDLFIPNGWFYRIESVNQVQVTDHLFKLASSHAYAKELITGIPVTTHEAEGMPYGKIASFNFRSHSLIVTEAARAIFKEEYEWLIKFLKGNNDHPVFSHWIARFGAGSDSIQDHYAENICIPHAKQKLFNSTKDRTNVALLLSKNDQPDWQLANQENLAREILTPDSTWQVLLLNPISAVFEEILQQKGNMKATIELAESALDRNDLLLSYDYFVTYLMKECLNIYFINSPEQPKLSLEMVMSEYGFINRSEIGEFAAFSGSSELRNKIEYLKYLSDKLYVNSDTMRDKLTEKLNH